LKYCFDTSSFITAWQSLYPPQIFPGIWGKLGELIDEGAIIIPDLVLYEIEQQEDDLSDWVKEKPQMVYSSTLEIQTKASEIINTPQFNFASSPTNANQADPFVIATAAVLNITVVTEEAYQNNFPPLGGKVLKIPRICEHYGIDCLSFIGVLKAEKWEFH